MIKNYLGDECTNYEEVLLTTYNLLDLCPDSKKLPDTQTKITPEDKQRLIYAYEELPKVFILNILTRDKLIQLYPNIQQENILNLRKKNYTDIDFGTFTIIRTVTIRK